MKLSFCVDQYIDKTNHPMISFVSIVAYLLVVDSLLTHGSQPMQIIPLLLCVNKHKFHVSSNSKPGAIKYIGTLHVWESDYKISHVKKGKLERVGLLPHVLFITDVASDFENGAVIDDGDGNGNGKNQNGRLSDGKEIDWIVAVTV